MSEPDIVGYISEPDIHDGTVLKVEHIGVTARVLVKTYEGQLYAFQFDLLESIKSFEPENMMIYSLIEINNLELDLLLVRDDQILRFLHNREIISDQSV